MNTRLKNTSFVSLLNIIIATLFLKGQNYNEAMSMVQYVIVGLIAFILVIGIPVITYFWAFLNKYAGNVRFIIFQKLQWLVKNLRRVLAAILLYVCAGLVSYFVTFLYSIIKGYSFTLPLFNMLFALISIFISVYLCRNQSAEKPERLFLILILIVGVYFIFAAPAEVSLALDEESHLDRVLNITNLPSNIAYKADEELISMHLQVSFDHYGFSEKDREERKEKLNKLWSDQETVPYVNRGMGEAAVLSYIPFCFGITMGRGLSLPYTMILRLGKLVHLLTYATVVFYAMKRLKFGKILLGTVGMIPTVTFMSASYTYDPCVIAGTLLGFAIFFSYLQQPKSKMTNVDIALICSSFFLGCLPKAVYCVIMFPLLFMPSNRFVSKKQHYIYLMSGFVTVGLLASSFVIPRLIYGMGVGDPRGGAEVNATLQFEYVLKNPVRFMQILWNFLITYYLNPIRSIEYLEFYGYLGANFNNHLGTALVLLITAFLDRNHKKGKTFIVGISTLIGIIFGIVIVAFTFYLSFTPVAYHTINGCQPRYLLPMVFPFLYIIGLDGIRNPISPRIFNVLPLLWMSLSFVLYTGIFMIKLY